MKFVLSIVLCLVFVLSLTMGNKMHKLTPALQRHRNQLSKLQYPQETLKEKYTVSSNDKDGKSSKLMKTPTSSTQAQNVSKVTTDSPKSTDLSQNHQVISKDKGNNDSLVNKNRMSSTLSSISDTQKFPKVTTMSPKSSDRNVTGFTPPTMTPIDGRLISILTGTHLTDEAK